MAYSYTFSESQTFTVTHAKHLASKVATDLKRIQRFYKYPSDLMIEKYETEIIELLKGGYLGTITYGFKKDGNWIEPTLRYTSKELAGLITSDDDPGRLRPNGNIDGASFYSYLSYNQAWYSLTQEERGSFEKNLPIQRSGAEEPGITGYLSNDKIYSSGGRSLERSIVKSY
jgi:hypothetical protein